MDLRLGWRNRDKGLVEGQPSMLGRARRERRLRSAQSPPDQTARDSLTSPVFSGPAQSLDESISTASPSADDAVTAPRADSEATAFLSGDRDAGVGERNDEQATSTAPEAELSEEVPAQKGSIQEAGPEVAGRPVSPQLEGGTQVPPPGSPATDGPEDPIGEPVRAQLRRLAVQLQGLQQQLDRFVARRGEAVADQASRQVATIVAAAEASAAEIRAGAQKDAGALRDRLLADLQADVERIRTEAQADAGRIRTEAHAEAARLRERTIAQATAQVDAFVARLAEDIRAAAREALGGIGGRAPDTAATAPDRAATALDSAPTGAASAADAVAFAPGTEPAASQVPPRVPTQARGPVHEKQIADEVEQALDELQAAAAALEESLRHLRADSEEQSAS